MRNHAAPSPNESQQTSHATRVCVRPCERRNKQDDDPLRAALDALLDRAATMELRDSVEAERLRADAHVLLARLVAAGRLPVYMTVAPDDALVVVLHVLAVAARRVNEADRTVPG